MAKPLKALSYLLALCVCAASLACGSGSTATVTGSNDTTQGSSGGKTQSVKGATIQGTLRSSTAATDPSASGVAADSMGGIKVSVVGTSIQVTSNGSGQFTLTGVPAGTAELRFQGKGLDARLTIGGLTAGQTLTLTFQVDGNSVSKVGDDDGQHGDNSSEVEGRIDSVAASSLMVAGRKVTVTSSTRILDHDGHSIALSSLKTGQKVEVEGVSQSDGSLQASKIKLEEGENDDDQGDDIHG